MSNSDRPTLVPGTYRLTQDVKNPKPDRRTRNDWTGDETVKAGSVFAVHPKPVGRDEYELSMKMQRGNGEVFAHSPLFAALVPFLEPVPEQALRHPQPQGPFARGSPDPRPALPRRRCSRSLRSKRL